VLHGSLAYLECRLHYAQVAGDHTIFIAEVEDAVVREGKPLLFFRGKYRRVGGSGEDSPWVGRILFSVLASNECSNKSFEMELAHGQRDSRENNEVRRRVEEAAHDEQYHVTREAGTECAFTGQILEHERAGDVSLRLLRIAAVRFADEV
jgi:hypothetical protein